MQENLIASVLTVIYMKQCMYIDVRPHMYGYSYCGLLGDMNTGNLALQVGGSLR
jgi:hypothetical protein